MDGSGKNLEIKTTLAFKKGREFFLFCQAIFHMLKFWQLERFIGGER